VRFTDQELLVGIARKDSHVLKYLYQEYFGSARQLVLRNNGSEDDARDIFQEVLLVIFRKVKQKDFALTCTLGTYLYSISKILWLKELNRRKRRPENITNTEEYIDPDGDVEALSEYNERMLIYRKYFDQLSADCKRVLTLFMEGNSISEITRIMGYNSEQHTKNRRYRCKQSLINNIRKGSGLIF